MASELTKRDRENDKEEQFTVQLITASGLNHEVVYTSCAWIPRTPLVIAGTRDGFVIVINMATMSVHKTFNSGIDRNVSGCVASPDGEFFVTSFRNGVVMVWDAKNLGGHFTLPKENDWSCVSCCTISPDGTFIVIGSSNGKLAIWDVDVDRTASKPVTCKIRGLISTGSGCPIFDCAVSPTTEFIVSASGDTTLKVWDATSPFVCHVTLQGHETGVFFCDVCSDGEFVISMSYDEMLRVWDTKTWKLYKETRVDHFGFGLYASPREKLVVIRGFGREELSIWDFKNDTVHTPSGVTEVEGSMLNVSSTYITNYDERQVTLIRLDALQPPPRRKRFKLLRK